MQVARDMIVNCIAFFSLENPGEDGIEARDRTINILTFIYIPGSEKLTKCA